jgi:two-component system sensor histidine kinase KdpD
VVFGLKAACLFDAGTAELHTTGNPQDGFGEKVRQAYILARDSDDLPARTSLRSLRVAGRTTGAIGFEGLDDPELMAGPLATLAAASLERERAFRTVSDAAAQAKTEVFRAAILDAIAHEFKTPLATILTAAGGLREAGPLGREQEELADLVETETVRLGSLTSRLLRMARLDREEIKLRTERLDIRAMVEAAVDRYSRLSPDRRFSIVQTTEPDEIIADAELLRLAFSQLLDNARKYSSTGSEIGVEIGMQNRLVSISVRNNGCSIPSDEQTRIFERYFRGTEGRRLAPGSGLGLYVARKIAVAHGGSLDLMSEDTARDGVAFRLTVPASRSESDLAGTSH